MHGAGLDAMGLMLFQGRLTDLCGPEAQCVWGPWSWPKTFFLGYHLSGTQHLSRREGCICWWPRRRKTKKRSSTVIRWVSSSIMGFRGSASLIWWEFYRIACACGHSKSNTFIPHCILKCVGVCANPNSFDSIDKYANDYYTRINSIIRNLENV